MITKFLNWINNPFAIEDGAGISTTCTIDENPVDCFTFKLEEKGFTYNEDRDWWERTWTVETKYGQETSLEVYKQDGDSWKTLMFGNEGDLFYEQTVGSRTDGYYTI